MRIADHPLLEAVVFETEFPASLGSREWPSLALPALLQSRPTDLGEVETKAAVRDLLRVGGFKPSGRSKPASEYVQKAIPAERLGAINPAVDACNAASFFSGLPISVVDLDATVGALHIAVADPDLSYVFNASGQEIRIGGLLCLHDASGACANAVKDSQRTKTSASTRRTLTVVWGTVELGGRAARVARWYRGVLEAAGCQTRVV